MDDCAHKWSNDVIFEVTDERPGHLTGKLKTCMDCGEVRWFHGHNSANNADAKSTGVLIQFREGAKDEAVAVSP